MPLLAAYFDSSSVSFLIKKDKKSVELLNFPYVYSKGILSNQCTEQQFYDFLITKILTDRRINISKCDILTSGLIYSPTLSIPTKFSVGVSDLIQNSNDFTPVAAGDFYFLSKDLLSSFSYCNEGDIVSKGDEVGQLNYYSNMCIYPQIVSNDFSKQSDIDEKILEKMPKDFKLEPGKILFTGGRFSQRILSEELSYVLILGMLKEYGIYEVYIDRNNAFSLSQMVKMYDKNSVFSIEDYIEKSGLFIRTGGSVECLLSSGVGDDQFIEIEKDKVFLMPLNLSGNAKLSLKSNALGSIDVKTNGGEVGIVFDTRVGNESLYKDVKLFNNCVKQFERSPR